MTINVDKEDGFVNGCTGILKDITYQNTSPFILLLCFHDQTTGKTARTGVAYTYPFQESKNWSPVFKIVRSFGLMNCSISSRQFSVERLQFPLVQASALSLQKNQGKTAHNGLVLYFQSGRPVSAPRYISLSRCPNEHDNYTIDSLYAHQIQANDKAIAEMYRLEEESPVHFLLIFPELGERKVNILFHNIQSLSISFPIIKNSIYCKESDLIFVETRLLATDANQAFEIPDFRMFDLIGTLIEEKLLE